MDSRTEKGHARFLGIGYVGFQGVGNVPSFTWLDIEPSLGPATPNRQINIGDILAAIGGFQGDVYPGDGPSGCP